ncbi:MAG: type IV secretory system conjugative DNA transfer family protein [Desulfovibrio sp.]|nr:type IV secretory system conjugative DNA transfer family protein [Desulfovibrio sp.]
MSSYPTVGFFAQSSRQSHPNNRKRKKKRWQPVPAADSTDIPESETLLEFDSGRRMTHAQGTRSTLVMGGTGSGKTASVVLPMTSNLIRAGYGGLILDVKGNLREQVRAIAASHGRLGDIVEFGSAPDANRCNFIAGMAEHEVADLMNVFATSGVETDHNIAWHQKGAKMCCDVAKMLSDISKINRECDFSSYFRPTLANIYSIITNRLLASGLWTYYVSKLNIKKTVCNKYGVNFPDYIVRADALYKQVSSEYFHILKLHDKNNSGKNNTTFEQNIAWSLERVNRSFKLMKHTHEILDRFSCEDSRAVPLDFDELIYKHRKIVLVHFAMDSGFAGDLISKSIKERFYQSVMRNGMGITDYTFMIGDEFQHIVDVSPMSRMNDMQFFSLSREFRNVNVIATQSIASLRSQGNKEAITALVANCMTKIMLQCSDPETIAWIKTFRPLGETVKMLRRGACMLEIFDHAGSNLSTFDKLNSAYTTTATALKASAKQDEEQAETSAPSEHLRLGQSGIPLFIESALMDMGNDDKSLHVTRLLDICRLMSRRNLPYWDEDARMRFAKSCGFDNEAGMTWDRAEAVREKREEEELERRRRRRQKERERASASGIDDDDENDEDEDDDDDRRHTWTRRRKQSEDD